MRVHNNLAARHKI